MHHSPALPRMCYCSGCRGAAGQVPGDSWGPSCPGQCARHHPGPPPGHLAWPRGSGLGWEHTSSPAGLLQTGVPGSDVISVPSPRSLHSLKPVLRRCRGLGARFIPQLGETWELAGLSRGRCAAPLWALCKARALPAASPALRSVTAGQRSGGCQGGRGAPKLPLVLSLPWAQLVQALHTPGSEPHRGHEKSGRRSDVTVAGICLGLCGFSSAQTGSEFRSFLPVTMGACGSLKPLPTPPSHATWAAPF